MFSQHKYKTYTISLVHLALYGIALFHSINENEVSLKFFFYIFLVLVNFLSMTNLSFNNPGFICKNFKNRNKEEIIKFQHKTEVRKYFNKGKWNLLVKTGNEEFIFKYCEECNIFKVKGVSHCRECDCCVHEMDHHCYWFETCIAKNNIRHFYLYLYSAIILFYFGTTSLKQISDLIYDEGILQRTLYCILTFMSLISFLILILLSCFSIYYFYLALTNINSREFIKNIIRYRKMDIRFLMKRIFSEQRKISCEQVHCTPT